jgi:7-carboxy-7-deazaguanine synthase
VDEVFDKVTCFPTNLVEVTGGEPLLQDSVHTLVERLLAEGKTVLIETGGSLDIRPVHRDVVLIYDIKCPGSGMADRNLWDNLRYLRKQDEIKFVISSREDYEWAKQVLQERGLSQSNLVLFSPAWQRLEARVLAEWILADGLPVRFQVQLHKHLWGDRRGV